MRFEGSAVEPHHGTEPPGLDPRRFPFAHSTPVCGGHTFFVPLALSESLLPSEERFQESDEQGRAENASNVDDSEIGASPPRDGDPGPAARVLVVALRGILSNTLFICSYFGLRPDWMLMMNADVMAENISACVRPHGKN